MINSIICEYVKNKVDKNKVYKADFCVGQGYGQNFGGYCEENDPKKERMLQVEHFINYYGVGPRNGNQPSYTYLRCPELLLFIAEIFEVNPTYIDNAYQYLVKYEDENGIKDTKKNGNYIWGKQVLRDIKKELFISEIVKTLKKDDTLKTMEEKIERIKSLSHQIK